MKKRRIAGAVLAAVMAFTGVMPSRVLADEDSAKPISTYRGEFIKSYAAAAEEEYDPANDDEDYEYDPAEEGTIPYPVTGGNIYYRVHETSPQYIEIDWCDDTVTEANIPAQIDGIPVTHVAGNTYYKHAAFAEKENLTKVTLPDTITNIGDEAFIGTGLAEITLPSGVTEIKDGSLAFCENLTTVRINSNNISIGDSAFSYSERLKSIEMNGSIDYIGERAFEYCNDLAKIPPISNRCSFIGESAFSHCKNLTEITIPGNVSYVGKYAFSFCESLADLTIENGVKSLSHAFVGCTSLTEITIPASVTDMEWAFSSCSGLISIIISSGVTSVSENAFRFCTALTEVTLPDGITSIGNGAFWSCENLEKINLPDGLTVIEDHAFMQCGKPADITIPDSVVTIGSGAFQNCGFFSDMSEITIPESVTAIGDAAFLFASRRKNIIVPASVTYIGEQAFDSGSSTIDKDGNIKIEDVTLLVKKGSYAAQYAADNGYTYEYNGSVEPVAEIKNKSDIKIKSAAMHYDGSVYDILNYSPEIVSGDDYDAQIYVDIDWGKSDPDDYDVFLKIGEKPGNPLTDYFEIQPGLDMDENDIAGIAVIKKDPENENEAIAAAEILKIKIQPKYQSEPQKEEDNGEFTFNFFDDFSLEINGEIPILGNKKLGSFAFKPDMAVVFEPDDDGNLTYKIGIGKDFEEETDDSKIKESVNEYIKTVKEIDQWLYFDKIVGDDSLADKKHTIESVFNYHDFKGGVNHKSVIKGFNSEFSVMGYIEGIYTIDKNLKPHIETAHGTVTFVAEGHGEMKGQMFVGAVPVTYGVGGGLSSKAEINTGDFYVSKLAGSNDLSRLFQGTLEITPDFYVTGGLGLVNVVELEAEGKGELICKREFPANEMTGDLKASLTLNLNAGPFVVGSYSVLEKKWQVYPPKSVNAYSLNGPSLKSDLDAPLTPADRSYADKVSVWNDGSGLKAYASGADVLQTNIYPNARPCITEANGKRIILWLADDTNRDEYNRNVLVYSVYDEQSGTWSKPEAVSDDGMLDLAPSVKNGCVIWQKANKKLTSADSLKDFAGSFDIYVSKFENGKFGTPTRLTNDNTMDSQPSIELYGSNAYAVWTKNTENDIFGTTGKNSIYYSEFKNNAWSAPKAIADGLNIIDSVSVGCINGEPVTVCSIDTDNSMETVDDRELFIIRNGKITRFTNDSDMDTKPVFAKLNGVNTLFWYNGNGITYVKDIDDPIIGGVPVYVNSDEVSVVSYGENAALFYTNTSDDGSEMCASLYDGVQWSDEIEITSENEKIKYPSGLIDGSGNITAVFARVNGTDGQTALCTKTFVPECDIAVFGVYAGEVEPNSELPVIFSIKNTGEKTVSAFDVEFTAPDGNVSERFTVNETLQPGEIYDGKTIYRTGSSPKGGKVTIKVCTEGTERNYSNNSSSYETKLAETTESFVYGDADGNGRIEANDAAAALQKALVGTFKMPIESKTSNWLKYTDVDSDEKIGANDSAIILQKALVSTFEMPVEKDK